MIDSTRSYQRISKRWEQKPSGHLLAAALELTNPLWTGMHRSVLRVFADQMRFDKDGWTPRLPITSRGRDSIASQSGCARRTVQRAIGKAVARGILEVDEAPGVASRYRIRTEPVFSLALDVTTATREQIRATKLEWHGHQRAEIDAWTEREQQLLELGVAPPMPEVPVKAVYVRGPWEGLTPAEKDEVLHKAVTRVTGREAWPVELAAAAECWRHLDIPAAEFLAELEGCLYGVEDNCRSYAFRFLRGEVAMDDGRPSIDHSREAKFLFQARYWKVRVGESRAHANGQCGCYHEDRRTAPPKADRTRPAIRKRRPELPPARDVPVLWFGWGKPEGELLRDPSACFAGCLARIRAIHGPAEVAPYLDACRIRVTDEGAEVLFAGPEGIYRRGHVARHLVDDLVDWLGCRVGLVVVGDRAPPEAEA